jgi:hypothetical protein
MVVGVGFCKIKVDSNFLLVLKIKCIKFHQDRSKTVDLHTKYTNKQNSVLYMYIDYIIKSRRSFCASPIVDLNFVSASISGISTKRFTSTPNDIIYYFCLFLL